MFCWGKDNNDPTVISELKRLGLNGVIYDRLLYSFIFNNYEDSDSVDSNVLLLVYRIDKLKSIKENVFSLEERQLNAIHILTMYQK